MKLCVDTEGHGTVCVEVKGSDKIKDVSYKIWEQTGNGYLYRLVWNRTLRLLDYHTVSQCGLYDGCRVKGRRRQLSITVVTDCGEEIWLGVWRDATVGKVKGMVEKKKGIPAAHQVLKYKGEELRDESTMKECGGLGGWHYDLQLVTREPAPVASSVRNQTRTLGTAASATATATATSAATAAASDKQDKSHQLSTRHTQLEQRVTAVEETMRENHQEVGQRLSETGQRLSETGQRLSETDQKLTERMAELELENKQVKQKVASLQKEISRGEHQKQRTGSNIQHKFISHYKEFFCVELDVADYLLQAFVLSQEKYDYIFDTNTKMSRTERVREMLKEVKKSESNIRAFHQALLDLGDARSKQLAAMLE